jgi:uncharacterized protein (DUF58 family)
VNFTWRARGLMALAALATAAGLLLRQEPLALSGLTIFLWIGLEWANFCFRTLTAEPMFADARRCIGGQSRNSHALVIDRKVEVEIELTVAARLAGLRCVVQDAVPSEIPLAGGSPSLTADVTGAETFTWRYRLRPRIIGKTTLPGLQATISDPQGLFRVQRFIPLRTEVSVLPFLIRPQATVSVLKRQNVQMLPGLHRHRKPGFSTELLGIRDYRSGDPPRSIAWKATARRGKLMTCEYENEAPVRATVLADLSPLQFVGRPGPAGADRVIAAAASVARLLLADGDPVAGLIVSRGEQTWLPHGAGERHLTRLLLRMLSLQTPLSLDDLELDQLTRLAWTCGYRRFPELFDEAVNQPLLGLFVRGRVRRQLARQRQQLSLALAVIYGGPPGLPMRLRFDDRLYRDYCRRLLEDYPGLLDRTLLHGSPRISSADERETTETLCRGLLTGAARSNDNELFVIAGTIPFEAVHRDRLLEAIRVLRAGHHRVVMIDVGADVLTARWEDELARRILSDTRRDAEADRFVEFERRLVRLGGKLARIPDAKLIEKVAAEIEILRMGRTRTTGGVR